MTSLSIHRLLWIGIALMIVPVCMLAEDEKNEVPKLQVGDWTFSGQVTGAASWNQYDDWQAGGTDSQSVLGKLEFTGVYMKDKSEWQNSFKSEYGTGKSEGERAKKSADALRLDSIYNYNFTPVVSAYGRGALSSTYTKGFQYYTDPVDAVFLDDRPAELQTHRVQVADSFDPINLEQGVGLGLTLYKNEDDTSHLKFRLGVGARELIVSNYYTEQDDADTSTLEFAPVEDYSDTGLDSGIDLKIGLFQQAQLVSAVSAFYGFQDEFWKVTWDTALTIGLGKFFGVSLTNSMIYDEMVFEDPQWKSGTLLTLSYYLF